MIRYNENVDIVLDTLHGYGYGPRAISIHEACFKELKSYLKGCGITQFSEVLAQNFTKTAGASSRDAYVTSIKRLTDVYQQGYVLRRHLQFRASHLSPELRKAVDIYVLFVTGTRSDIHVQNIRHSCEHFCSFIQLNGGTSLSDVTYPLLEKYDHEGRRDNTAFSIREGLVEGFLLYWADKNVLSYGYGLFMYYIQSCRVVKASDLSTDTQESLMFYMDDSRYFPAAEFFGSINGFIMLLEEAGYGKYLFATAKSCLNLLFLFLDMHGLGYHRSIVELWYKESQDELFGTGKYTARRIMELYDDYARDGEITPQKWWKHRVTQYDLLPEWCRAEIDPFIWQKKKERWDESTINMYTSCAVRFCWFIVSKDIKSFAALTPEVIKEFNRKDEHQTHEAKNAYNSRIRKFLTELEQKGIVQEGLHFALPGMAASGERIVEVLSDADRKAIELYSTSSSTPLAYRDIAIILIGMDMGLRASDIVTLKISDINWKNSSIRFVQNKTGVEHRLPMTVRTGNAIFKYLKDGRPRGRRTNLVFISSKAPFGSLNPVVCAQSLVRAGVSTRKFHTTRRTFATDCLNNGASVSETAEALGHRDKNSVHKYLSLDEERMLLCPLSLSEVDLPLREEVFQ